ncbi:MAG: hypothetical protein NVSMB56_03680 [Pyrinomonadaceae bacterium]
MKGVAIEFQVFSKDFYLPAPIALVAFIQVFIVRLQWRRELLKTVWEMKEDVLE